MTLKRLERGWKSIWLRLLCLLLSLRGTPPPLDPSRPQRILFLRQDRIGDAIVSSGLLRGLHAAAAGNAVDVIASPVNAAILRQDPSVDYVHLFNKKKPGSFLRLVRRLRRGRYDVVIDCMVTAPSTTALLLMAASGARHRIGMAGRGVDRALTIPVSAPPKAEHIIDRMAAFGLPFGLDPVTTDWRPHLAVSPDDLSVAEKRWRSAGSPERRRLLVNVSAGREDRRWPDQSFVEVIRGSGSNVDGPAVIVVGAPAEADRASAIAAAAGAMAVSTPSITDVIGLVATADCVLTPDTSVTHMASALRVPAVAMFQDGSIAAQWGLYRNDGTNVVGDVAALAELPVGKVLPALQAMLGALSVQPAARGKTPEQV